MTNWVDAYIAYFVPEADNPDHEGMKEGFYFRTEDEQLVGEYETKEIAQEALEKYCNRLSLEEAKR